MIHDDLARRFAQTPQPSLSPEFSMNLRRALRTGTPATRRAQVLMAWAPRLYWIAVIALLARYWRPVSLTPMQAAVVAVIAAVVLLTVRRAARPGSLPRILRHAIWR